MADNKNPRFNVGNRLIVLSGADDDLWASIVTIIELDQQDDVWWYTAQDDSGSTYVRDESYFYPLAEFSELEPLAIGDVVDFVGIHMLTNQTKRPRGKVSAIAEDGLVTAEFPAEYYMINEVASGKSTITAPRSDFRRVDVAPTTKVAAGKGTMDAYQARRGLLKALHDAFPEDASMAVLWSRLQKFERDTDSLGLLTRIIKRAHGEREAQRIQAMQGDKLEID